MYMYCLFVFVLLVMIGFRYYPVGLRWFECHYFLNLQMTYNQPTSHVDKKQYLYFYFSQHY